MYSINGVPLDNQRLGWRYMRGSNPYADVSEESTTVIAAGRDGDAQSVMGRVSAPILPFVVTTPRANLEALTVLFRANGILSDGTGRTAQLEFVSRSIEHWGMGEDKVNAIFLMKLPGVYWRGEAVTSPARPLGAFTLLSVLPGISAPVQDAEVRVQGACTGLTVRDTAGSWFTYPRELKAGEWLLFRANQSQAFIGTAPNSWTAFTSDVSGLVDFGGPRGVFEITPRLVSSVDPSIRDGRLEITTTTWASASIQVRARPAYLI